MKKNLENLKVQEEKIFFLLYLNHSKIEQKNLKISKIDISTREWIMKELYIKKSIQVYNYVLLPLILPFYHDYFNFFIRPIMSKQ